MVSPSEIEQRWIDAWSEVYEIVGANHDTPCLLLPAWSIVSVDECLEWIQESVYSGHILKVEASWVGHRRGVVVQEIDN